MKRMWIRGALTALAAACLFGLAACSPEGGESSAPVAVTPSSALPESYASLEEFMGSDRVQDQLEEFRSTLPEGMTAGISCEGDRMVYTFQYGDLGDVDRKTLALALESAADGLKDIFREQAASIKEYVGIQDPVVAVTYLDAEGEVLYTKDFTLPD